MQEWLTVLRACSESMSKQVRPLFGAPGARTGFGVGAGGDVKRKIDLVAENALFKTLEEHGVSCTVVSEESGVKQIGSEASQYYVIADPVDGTTNGIRGLPFIDISIAVSRMPMLNSVETALVTDVLRDVTYTAERGKGARREGEIIRPSETAMLEEAVVGVDFSSFRARQVVNRLIRILEKTQHLRHLGANALEICYVADGTIDAFIDVRGKLRVTDVAAAQLILIEAGGIIKDPTGGRLDAPLTATERVSFVAASNKFIYDAIQKEMTIREDES